MPNCLRSRPRPFIGALGALGLIVGLAAGCASAGGPADSTPGLADAFANPPRFDMSWRRALDPPDTWEYEPRQYSTPHYRAASDALFVGTDSARLVKVRGADGKVLWKTKVDGPVHAEPAYGDGRVYVGSLGGTFYAVDEADGQVIWKRDVAASVESRALWSDGRVFYTTDGGLLAARDAATGKSLWTYERKTPEYFTVKETGHVVVDDAVVYCGFADGVLAALQLDTGDLLWESDLSGGKTEFIDVDQPPILVGSRIYAASYDGGLYALDKASGEHVWHRQIDGITDMAYAENQLYLATADGRILQVGADEGDPTWAFSFQEQSPVSIRPTSLYLFVSTAGGPLYVIDRRSGRPLMNWDPSSGFNARFVLGETGSFAYSNRGYLYGFDVAF